MTVMNNSLIIFVLRRQSERLLSRRNSYFTSSITSRAYVMTAFYILPRGVRSLTAKVINIRRSGIINPGGHETGLRTKTQYSNKVLGSIDHPHRSTRECSPERKTARGWKVNIPRRENIQSFTLIKERSEKGRQMKKGSHRLILYGGNVCYKGTRRLFCILRAVREPEEKRL